MQDLAKILDVLALQRSRLESDIGRLTSYVQKVDAEIARLHAQTREQAQRLTDNSTSDMIIHESVAFHQWRHVTKNTIATLESKKREALDRARPLKDALKELLVKSDLIDAQMKARTKAAYDDYVEEQSATRLETWIATRPS